MSLKALIDAAQYVDKDEMTSEESNPPSESSESPSSATSQRRLSGDATITHWRKRAVAQSVLELNNKTPDQASSNGSFKGSCGSTSSISDDIDPNEWPRTSHPENNTEESDAGTTSDGGRTVLSCLLVRDQTRDQPGHYNPLTINSEDAVTMSAHHHSSLSPVSSATASSPTGSVSNTGAVLPDSPKLPHGHTSLVPHRKDRPVINGDLPWEGIFGLSSLDSPNKRHGTNARETHNQLEKSRRRYLKQCYERLRSSMPKLGPKTSHLTILREAIKTVQVLERREQMLKKELAHLTEENKARMQRLKRAKDVGSRYLEPAEMESMLRKACEQIQKKPVATAESRGTNNSSQNTSTSQTTMENTTHKSPSEWPQNGQGSVTVNGFLQVPADSVFPPLSSTMNLVNEARRLCTMLPAMRVLASSAVQRNAQPNAAGSQRNHTMQRAVQFPMPVGPTNTQFRPYSNVRAYTGFSMPQGGGTFMQSNPLKIVVKQVDSAKQQARAIKPGSGFAVSSSPVSAAAPVRNKQVVTPSNAESEFGVFPFNSAGSPPLLSAGSLQRDSFRKGSLGGTDGLLIESNRAHRRPRSKSDIEDLYDDPELHSPPRKRKSNSSAETFPAKLQKPESWRKLPDPFSKPVHSRQNSVKSPGYESSVNSENERCKMVTPSSSVAASAGTLSSVSARINASKSITQVCFTTLNNTKPAIPKSMGFRENLGPESEKSSGMESTAGTRIQPMMTGFPGAAGGMMQMLPMPMQQNMIPVMMPMLASPSMGFMMAPKSAVAYTSASSEPAVTQTTAGATQVCRSNVQNQTQGINGMAHFPYMMPMAFPGMMASNCSPMMMQTPMNGFMPMMPQGQNWGFVMPQGMMMMPPGDRKLQQPKSECDTKTNVKGGSDSDVSHTVSASGQSQDSSAVRHDKAVNGPRAPKFQMMPAGFPGQSQYMMPMQAGPGGGYYFGGTPAMMPANGQPFGYQMPMNVMGFPVQFGAASGFQGGLTGPSVRMCSTTRPSSSDETKANVTGGTQDT